MRSLKILLQAAVVALVATSAGVSAAVPRYKVEMLITEREHPYALNQLFDLNNQGEVIGQDYDRLGSAGFVWSHGKFQGLEVEGYDFRPARLNDRGQIAGSTVAGTFLYDHGRATKLNPTSDSIDGFGVSGLNNAGHVAGFNGSEENAEQYYYDGHTTRTMGIWQKLNIPPYYVEIYDLNNRDDVLGSYLDRDTNKRVQFTWRHGEMTLLPQFEGDEFGYVINDAGHVAGSLRSASNEYRPVVFRDGMAVDLLGSAPGQGQAVGLNNQGWAVGSLFDAPSGPYTAFLYRDGRMYDLNDLLVDRDARRWSLSGAFRLNEAGQMLVGGLARDNSRLRMQALLTPVPEPQTWLLMLAGMGLLAGMARVRCKPNPTPGARRCPLPA
jgi:probable HAF family extracellular repeat protein